MSKINNISSWEYFYIYLSGPIDAARGSCNQWREDWIERLVNLGFDKKRIFNPCNKPLEGAPFNLNDEGKIMQEHRDARKYSELCKVVKQIAHVDLRLVDLSSLILVNFPVKGKQFFAEIEEKFENLYNAFILSRHSRFLVDEMRSVFYELLTQAAMSQIPTYGTLHEIVEARRQKKPVLIVWEGGKHTCSGWLMWLVGHNNVFSTFDEMEVKLSAILSGKEEYDADDWLLLNLDKNSN